MSSRTDRLLPGGVPRYVRCYDSGGEGDRYTVVFTGRYRHQTDGDYVYIGMNAAPFHPQGIGMHGSARRPIDTPTYGHLGKRIKFDTLPPDCQRLALRTYRDLWDIEP